MSREGVVGNYVQTNSREVYFENERFVFDEVKCGKRKIVLPPSDTSVIISVFSMETDSVLQIKSNSDILCIGGDEHNLVSISELGCLNNLSGKNSELYYVSFSEDVFIDILGQNDAFSFWSDNGGFVKILTSKNMKITPEMRSIVTEITTCKREGSLKNMFIEAKILKLLMLQLEQSEYLKKEDNFMYIKEYDVEKIHQAKSILDDNISDSVSIVELAHRVGLNDYKLKRGFKEIFNSTVYNYLYELRMNEAKTQLLSSNKTVNEIAANCGYEFVQSFIKAFKRKFGISPERYRNACLV